jgi:uncharacterized protein YhaN
VRIRKLNLFAYGKFTNQSLVLPFGEQDFHLIVGPNEAGKSTVRSAISDWLFGIPNQTPMGFVHPLQDLKLGGALERLNARRELEQTLEFVRIKARLNSLRDLQGAVLPDALVEQWLGSTQKKDFSLMYGLDHTQLVSGSQSILSATDDIGRLLFQSAAGIEHIGEVLKSLKDQTDALWAPRAAAHRQYYKAQAALKAATDELKKMALRTADWKQHDTKLVDLENKVKETTEQETNARRRLSQLERVRRVQPLLLELASGEIRLADLLTLGPVIEMQEVAGQILTETQEQSLALTAQLSHLTPTLTEAQANLAAIKIDRTILLLEDEIGELNNRRIQYLPYLGDIAKHKSTIENEWLQIKELAASLVWSNDTEEQVRQRVPALVTRERLTDLTRRHDLVANDLRMATETLEQRAEAISQTEAELETLVVGEADPALTVAVESATNLGEPVRLSRELDVEIQRLKASLDAEVAGLGRWACEPGVLAMMAVPELTSIKELQKLQTQDELSLRSLQDESAKKATEIKRQGLVLTRLVRDHKPIAIEQVIAARNSRDSEWQAIKNAPHELAERTLVFEGQIVDADLLADARLGKAAYEAERQTKADHLKDQEVELAALDEKVGVIQAHIEKRLADWAANATLYGLPNLPLEAAATWLETRGRALALASQLAEQTNKKKNFLLEVEAARVALSVALYPLQQDINTTSYAQLLTEAKTKLALIERTKGDRDRLQTQLAEAKRAHRLSLQKYSASETARQKWLDDWLPSLVLAGYPATVAVEQVDAELGTIQKIAAALEKIDGIQRERIDTMQSDLDALALQASELASRVAPDLSAVTTDQILISLSARLVANKDAANQENVLQQSVDSLNEKLNIVKQQQAEIQAKLKPLFSVAGTSDEQTLANIIERSNAYRLIQRDLAKIKIDLARASDGLSVEQLRCEANSIDPDELVAEIERINRNTAELVEQLKILGPEMGQAKSALELFDGADKAARVESQRQEAMSDMSDAAVGYLKVHTAARVLQWSMDKFRETQQGPLLAKASTLFKTLTRGSFERLAVDTESGSPKLFGIRPDRAQVMIEGMSEGTRDQLYLALRLSALELQVEKGKNMPLIADDLFINFDDQRTIAGLSVLGDLSKKMQVVYLTHHVHLVDLAKTVFGDRLNVIELA